MIVRCANCHTEFSLDDRQVGPEGASVRCSVCAYVFHVAAPVAGTDQPWQIRTLEDLLFSAPDLATLRSWIEEGRLHPDDKVSRTGKHWLRLGDMPEFSESFHGYGELPKVMTPVGASETSGAEDLGPPPAFAGDSTPGTPVASLLGAVTQHVQPQPNESATPTPVPAAAAAAQLGAGPSASTPPSVAAAAPSPSVAPSVVPAAPPPAAPPPAQAGPESSWSVGDIEDSEDSDASMMELMVAKPRAGKAWLWGLAGVAAGVGLVFGVPQIRNSIMGPGGDVVEPEEVTTSVPPEVTAASEALARLDPTELGRAEATLQSKLDEGGLAPAGAAAMKLAQAEVLAIRALELEVQAAVDATGSEAARAQATDFAARADRIFGALGTEVVSDRTQLKRVRAVLRLAQGRSADEILALLPDAGASELRAWVLAAPLWRAPEAKVPPNVIGQLRAIESPGMLSRVLLTVAYMRGGDTGGATGLVTAALSEVPSQPTLLAIQAVLSGDAAAEDTDGAVQEPTEDAKASRAAGTPDTKEAKGGSEPGGGGAVSSSGMSTDKLIDKGCSKVEGGDASGGIALLLRAFDRRPGDLDVLVCLAKGNAKQGNRTMAATYYERALNRSPRHRGALVGAAKLAEKSGQNTRAVKYYKRLLQVDPSHGAAKAFVAKHDVASVPAPGSKSVDAPARPPSG